MHSASDALSYEGSVTAAMINGFSGTNKLVDGPALIAADGNVTSGFLASSRMVRTPTTRTSTGRCPAHRPLLLERVFGVTTFELG